MWFQKQISQNGERIPMEKNLFISRKNKTKQNLWTQFMRRKEYSELLWRKYSCIEFCLKLFFKNSVSSPFSHRVLWQHMPLTRRPRTRQRTLCAEQSPGKAAAVPARPERTATSGAPQRYRLMHPAIKFLLMSRVLWASCISITKVGIESSACWKTFFPVHSQVPLSDHVGSVACFF